MKFECIEFCRGRCYFIFQKILVIVIFQTALHENTRNFAYNIYIYPSKDDIAVIFAGIICYRVLKLHFLSEFWKYCSFWSLLNEIIQKFICKIYISRNINDTF